MTLDVEDSEEVTIDPVPVHEAAGSQSIN